MRLRICWMTVGMLVAGVTAAAAGQRPASPGDWLAEYFEQQTAEIEANALPEVSSLEEWNPLKKAYRRELLEMLGLWPTPKRAELKPVVTGTLEYPDFVVEKLHFQSLPGLYVTANFYLPRERSGPVPAILYVCGHAEVKTNGISCGNKTSYQHHGIWFARNGYACLVLDTVQLGEIEGVHHGTYREGWWWWNSRGYTPAGVEVWNAVRAMDYLEGRSEVDAGRLGMTGRSGGGWYTWATAAIDERVKVAAPVAGITDLRNHVVDGCVEGHCDCMYFINTYRWDFPRLAALVAPRPLLIVNTDSDPIFPLDGVERLHAKVKRIYELHGLADHLGLVIGPGPHRDTQDLQVPVFRWMNRHLRQVEPLITEPAEKLIDPLELRVFTTPPAESINARIHDTFVPERRGEVPEGLDEVLRREVFHGWPANDGPLALREAWQAEVGELHLSVVTFESQPMVRLPLFLAEPATGDSPGETVLEVLDEAGWSRWLAGVGQLFPVGSETRSQEKDWPEETKMRLLRQLRGSGTRYAWVAPRGIGPSAWQADERQEIQIRRRFMLLGQTRDGMRVWDVRRATQALRSLSPTPGLTLAGERGAGVGALYAALSGVDARRLRLRDLPSTQVEAPDYLNILRWVDLKEALEWIQRKGVVLELEISAPEGG